jgi:hypothetical protein
MRVTVQREEISAGIERQVIHARIQAERGSPSTVPGPEGPYAITAIVLVSDRHVEQVVGFSAGGGDPGDIGKYVGASGLVDDAADAVEITGLVATVVDGGFF